MKRTATMATAFLLHFCTVYGQLQKTATFYRKTGWLCSESILLDSTGLFFQEWGCESDVRVTFGKYNLTKAGRLSLKFMPLDSITPIAYRKHIDVSRDSIVEIRFIDRERKPIYSSFQLTLVDTANNFERRWLDENGLIFVNYSKYKELILDQLTLIYDEVLSSPINEHSQEIQFNLPNSFLNASQTSRGIGESQTLFVKKDGLYSNTKKRLYQLLN